MYDIIKDRKIKVALVGCGRIANNHFGSIEKHQDSLELVAVCDTNAEALAQAVARCSQAKAYSRLQDMLAETNADLIILTTPSGQHPQQAVDCFEAGFHVLTEKPMATRLHDGERMVQAADKAGKRLFVVKQNRLNATMQLLKRAVEEKRFGNINMVHLNVFWTRPQDYYDQGSWRGTWEFDGGAFMNQASHYVDLMEWLIGPVQDVHAMTSTHRDIETEDTGVVNIRWRHGALGSMAVTMCTYPKNYEGSITILGDKGTVRIGGVAVNDIQTWEFEDEKDYDIQINDANYETTSVYGFGHPLYYKNVIDVLRGEAEPLTDGREGLKSLELLIAIYLSARDNKTVSLPLTF